MVTGTTLLRVLDPRSADGRDVVGVHYVVKAHVVVADVVCLSLPTGARALVHAIGVAVVAGVSIESGRPDVVK